MTWLNYYGLAMIGIMMIPNAICAARNKGAFVDLWENKPVHLLEQIGRFACFGLMIVNIPYTWLGFWFDNVALPLMIAGMQKNSA